MFKGGQLFSPLIQKSNEGLGFRYTAVKLHKQPVIQAVGLGHPFLLENGAISTRQIAVRNICRIQEVVLDGIILQRGRVQSVINNVRRRIRLVTHGKPIGNPICHCAENGIVTGGLRRHAGFDGGNGRPFRDFRQETTAIAYQTVYRKRNLLRSGGNGRVGIPAGHILSVHFFGIGVHLGFAVIKIDDGAASIRDKHISLIFHRTRAEILQKGDSNQLIITFCNLIDQNTGRQSILFQHISNGNRNPQLAEVEIDTDTIGDLLTGKCFFCHRTSVTVHLGYLCFVSIGIRNTQLRFQIGVRNTAGQRIIRDQRIGIPHRVGSFILHCYITVLGIKIQDKVVVRCHFLESIRYRHRLPHRWGSGRISCISFRSIGDREDRKQKRCRKQEGNYTLFQCDSS